jgi:hypothetical protein
MMRADLVQIPDRHETQHDAPDFGSRTVGGLEAAPVIARQEQCCRSVTNPNLLRLCHSETDLPDAQCAF